MDEQPELRSARLLLDETSGLRYCRGPLSNVIDLIRHDLAHSSAALAASTGDRSTETLPTQQAPSSLISPVGTVMGERDALLERMEEDVKCLVRASAESRHQDEAFRRAPRGGTDTAWAAAPGQQKQVFSHPDEHEALQRVRERLTSCCVSVDEFLAHGELATLSSFPRMSSPYRALRRLLVAEYEFGECLQHTKTPWSSVVPKMIPKLEDECAAVETSFEKWEWTDGAYVDPILTCLAGVLKECESALSILQAKQQSSDDASEAERKLRLLRPPMDRFYEYWNQTALPIRGTPNVIAPLQRLLTPIEMLPDIVEKPRIETTAAGHFGMPTSSPGVDEVPRASPPWEDHSQGFCSGD